MASTVWGSGLFVLRDNATMTAVLEDQTTTEPQTFSLAQNYPNPFNSGTVIAFALPANSDVRLAVYNLQGQNVATLVEGTRHAGTYTVNWDGRDESEGELASGVYLYRLAVYAQVETRKWCSFDEIYKQIGSNRRTDICWLISVCAYRTV